MTSLVSLRQNLRSLANDKKAEVMQGFFKTGKGEYGEGDIFLGLTVPQSRTIAKKYSFLSFQDIEELLKSKIHEERLISLLILVNLYNESNANAREEIVKFYLSNTKRINNWDLVDSSADKILGNYLSGKDKSILYKLAESEDIWERRISIISTFHFIKNNKFEDTLRISEILLKDKHDLIHKAVGWMLREIGKKDEKILKDFLKKHYKIMPRTMLRYSIERFPEKERKKYLQGLI